MYYKYSESVNILEQKNTHCFNSRGGGENECQRKPRRLPVRGVCNPPWLVVTSALTIHDELNPCWTGTPNVYAGTQFGLHFTTCANHSLLLP